MSDGTHTTSALLEHLHDSGNDAAWREFDDRYRPLLVGFSRRLGLAEADAVDVAQETVMQFIQEYRDGKYDRERGRLRSWLIGIARYRIAGVYRQRARRRIHRGESAIADLPRDRELEAAWDTERRMAILRAALQQLRTTTKIADQTIRVFEMVAIQNQETSVVAQTLGLTENDVYLAKSRVAARLREMVASLEKLYDEETV